MYQVERAFCDAVVLDVASGETHINMGCSGRCLDCVFVSGKHMLQQIMKQVDLIDACLYHVMHVFAELDAPG